MLSAESINYIDNQVFLSVDIEQDAYLVCMCLKQMLSRVVL